MTMPNLSITTADPNQAMVEWFEKLGRWCASIDYDSTLSIFAEDVLSFGTKADIVSGLNLLRENQWEGIWPKVEGFRINMETLHSSGDERHAWGIATWTSTGFNEDGTTFVRPGRATTILERRGDRWLSVHTHFSLNPGTPARTHGRK